MWTAPDSPLAGQWADTQQPSDWLDAAFFEAPVAYRPPPAAGDDDRLLRLRLIRSRRVGPATYLRLLAEHGTAAAALEALPEVAAAAGVREYEICPEAVVMAELRAAERVGARMICLGDAAYPACLAEIGDAPPVLWAIGRPALMARPCVALVGTRNASSLGTRMARKLAATLGEAGFTIVSGLARGIDAIAHKSSLETGTVAVLAGGVDVVYPTENAEIAAQIAEVGLRLSEQPLGLQPQARHFPRRNRIVSGLARGVIVVEAAARSGSLITARCAAEQGRDVMAVPGHPLDSRASGANILLRDGATLVRGVEDVIEALGAPKPPPGSASAMVRDYQSPPPVPSARDGGLEGRILSHAGAAPVAEDQLIRDLSASPRDMAQALAVLEMSGRVIRSSGGMISVTTPA
ncbi:DNA-processing protein DprA [Gymnodinialimonas ceratoperidinii]|uniref:DNA-processing protein DprA n=1 Tax=Gymnodinialimonas ceratoperidinii TaxID=2856823 RepID=A0A8F6TYB0_9RHOB|nr:DNA-processing protein DprA [Gymnodinialimonas ceratoperidinii]QXT40935.1 DNA-processing protein DprA [Gymnodinialimonas ceratoperidinii]